MSSQISNNSKTKIIVHSTILNLVTTLEFLKLADFNESIENSGWELTTQQKVYFNESFLRQLEVEISSSFYKTLAKL